MKPSSSTQGGPRSVKVCTLDGSKDVRGARREPKGRPGLNVLATGCPWLCGADRTRELDLSCTKGDPMRPQWGKCGFVLGIIAQLVATDLNLRLYRIVRNLVEPLHRSNWIIEYDGSDEYKNLTPAMVTFVMLLNDITHV